MGIVTTTPFTLSAAIANGGTISRPYPAGYTQADFTELKASARGAVSLNNNEIYTEIAGQISITYGASNITILNTTGLAWPVGALFMAEYAFTTPGGTVIGDDPDPEIPSLLSQLTAAAATAEASACGDGITDLLTAGTNEERAARSDAILAQATGGEGSLPAAMVLIGSDESQNYEEFAITRRAAARISLTAAVAVAQAATMTCDLSLGDAFVFAAMTATRVLDFSNIPSGSDVVRGEIIVPQNGTGGYGLTISNGSVKGPAQTGGVLALNDGASEVTIIPFIATGGTVYL